MDLEEGQELELRHTVVIDTKTKSMPLAVRVSWCVSAILGVWRITSRKRIDEMLREKMLPTHIPDRETVVIDNTLPIKPRMLPGGQKPYSGTDDPFEDIADWLDENNVPFFLMRGKKSGTTVTDTNVQGWGLSGIHTFRQVFDQEIDLQERKLRDKE